MENKYTASQRRILMTKWVAAAWKSVSGNCDMITRPFRKCGITVPIDGTADFEIHIEGI
ncbi:hypothetical protein EV426DRAFT_618191, partial [Tirmania nivea]